MNMTNESKENPAANSTANVRAPFRKWLLPSIGLAFALSATAVVLHLLDREEETQLQEKYYLAEKADFLVTVKLTGTLVATDVVTLKSELEGETTIQSIIEEGTEVNGNTTYLIKKGDTLQTIAV